MGGMPLQKALLSLSIIILLRPVPCSASQGVASLEAAHALLVQAVDSGNIELVAKSVHPRALGFFRGSQFPVVLTPQHGIREVLPQLLTELSDLIATPYDSEFKVIGQSGIVCSRFVYQKGGKSRKETMHSRATYVYSRIDERWLLISWHTSDIP